uniref:Calcium voltage-gated channel auxiliary subunit alpha2delta 4 n=1 Tax=Cyprinus carpio TaxID=7962 RepID=A0A8C1S437_CYPCA
FAECYFLNSEYNSAYKAFFIERYVEPIVKMQEVDGLKMVKEFAEEMENMLGRKMKSVKRMAETVEDADFFHEYNATLEFDYYNSMMINTLDEDGNSVELGGEFPLEENEHFNKLPVSTQQSVIQVPTNVYNKDTDILNGVFMSEALNEVFTSNFEKDPTLTWQYFGSSTGFFRLYPGIKWTPDENGVVTFDARNRNWYIQAATSPKDIIIAVDISGSMKGLRLTIAKHTINTILDTLGENDFVNVIAYSDYVRYVEPCFKGTLVQADLDNREHFKLLVEELQVKGEGKVKKAIKESFKILNEVWRGSLCNQAIMLITDGAMEDFQQVFEEFNWPERKVRVFTYLIGRELTFADNVKWIACNNKGYYTHISTLADVQENVMEYLHVLSRPMVINHEHDIIWTEAYMDSVLFNTQAESLLLMTSVAMPVFSKKEETLSHGILLGVVGTDVPLKELMRLAPRYKYKDGKKLKPKPNYNSVDLSEVEWEDTEDAVSGTTHTHTHINKLSSFVFLKNEYFYTTINETPFSLGIVLTKGHGKNVFIGNVSVEEGLHDLTASDVTIANEWTYCETDIDPHHRKLTQFQAVVQYLTGKEPDLECDERLLQHTLFDAVVTAPMEAYWTALLLNASGIDGGVETAFLGTRSGLMRIIRYVGAEKRVAKKFLSPTDKENIFTLDHFPVWYRRAAENPSGRFLYYVPIEDSTQGSLHPAIHIIQTMRFYTLFRISCSVFFFLSLQWMDVNCYVIDSNGFIIISKDRTDVGRFLGKIDGSVMSQLLKMGMFKRVLLYDYQAMCKVNPHYASGARPLLSVSTVLHFFSARFLLDFNIYSLWHSDPFAEGMCKAKSYHHFIIHLWDILQPCDTEYPSFVYEPSIKETNSMIKCGRCQKMFVINQIPDSNLLLVVIQADCDCSRHFIFLNHGAHNASVKCDRMRSQKIRRRPESCHAYHPQENAKDCGGAAAISLSIMLFLACLSVSALIRR